MNIEHWQQLALVPGALDGYWLNACEETGTVRDAFIRSGLKAISCDLKGSRTPGPHYRGDVRDILYLHKWAGIIAHPDCTYLTLAGVRWLMDRAPSTPKVLKGPERWVALHEACAFFNLFLDHPCERVVVENPIPHRYAAALLRRPYTQTIQPYEYGHPETKRTCLWVKGLPSLTSTDNVRDLMLTLPKSQSHRVHHCSPGERRAEIRSEFYAGIGDAMARQWGLAA